MCCMLHQAVKILHLDSAAEGIPGTLHVCSLRFDVSRWIVTEECWVSGVEIVSTSLRVVGNRSPGASGGQ